MDNFVAIDFETANFAQSSVCSVGLVIYEFECTLLRSRKVWQEGHHNLDIIAGYCGYEMTNHHHALADAEACAIIAKQIL